MEIVWHYSQVYMINTGKQAIYTVLQSLHWPCRKVTSHDLALWAIMGKITIKFLLVYNSNHFNKFTYINTKYEIPQVCVTRYIMPTHLFYCHGRITHSCWLCSLILRDVLKHWKIGHHRMEYLSNYTDGLFKILIWSTLYISYLISIRLLIYVIKQTLGARILIVFVMSVVC